MTITIKLKTDNAAFEDKHTETLRIIQAWLDDAARYGDLLATNILIDYNGNTVGSVRVTGK
jgi:hypothetical protein